MGNNQSKINNDYYDFKELCENIQGVIMWDNIVDRVLEEGGIDGGVEFMKVFQADGEKLRRLDAEYDIDVMNVFYRYTRGSYGVNLAGSCVCENSYLYWLRKEQGVENLLVNKTWSFMEDNYKYNPESEFHYFISYTENGVRMMEDCSNGVYCKMPLKDYKKASAYKENECWTTTFKPKYTKNQAISKWNRDLEEVKQVERWEHFFHHHGDPEMLCNKVIGLKQMCI